MCLFAKQMMLKTSGGSNPSSTAKNKTKIMGLSVILLFVLFALLFLSLENKKAGCNVKTYKKDTIKPKIYPHPQGHRPKYDLENKNPPKGGSGVKEQSCKCPFKN